MSTPTKFGLLLAAIVFTLPARADEIRLKDGKKLNGVIVAYEDNMFKVKTDFGYVLVEKDKIAAIIPTSPAPEKKEKKDPPKKEKETPAAKSLAQPGESETQPAVEHSAASAASVQPSAEKSPVAKAPTSIEPKRDPKKEPASVKSAAVRAASPQPAAAKPVETPTKSADSTTQPLAPKEPELPPNRESVDGNTYTNFTHHFRMFKAPSWELIEDARRALPNAVVAMGTNNESTLLVIGEEKAGASLETAAASVEKRLRDVYESYRRISQEKITVAGQPAVEFKYAGRADDHDWSGTLVVVSRGSSTITILGMTYADNDLIQIQENVINRAISSLDFNVP